MRKLFFSFLLTALILSGLYVLGWLPGVIPKDGVTTIVIFVALLSLINMTVGAFLRIITFPINIITLGVFSFLISIVVVWITASLYPSIVIVGWIAYVIIACVMTLVTMITK